MPKMKTKSSAKKRLRLGHQGIQLVHGVSSFEMKKGIEACGSLNPFFGLARSGDQAASLALTCSTMLPKAALSWTAKSANTLRSMAMAAFFRPLANWL